MRREWLFFDHEVIQAELDAIPAKDAAKLLSLMEHYRLAGSKNPSPAKVDDYGDGIKRLRHIKPAYKGRVLFFVVERDAGVERLIVVTVYKKESHKVPHQILDRAKHRKSQYEKGKANG